MKTTARRAAVCGKPIAHSLSPVIHSAGYAAAGLLSWSYTAIECAEAELPDLVAGLGPQWAGLSLTMPLKEAALALAQQASPVALATGAANTLVRRDDGTWYADNTDVPGMIRVLTAAGLTATGLTPAGLTATGLTATGLTPAGQTATGLTATGLTATGLISADPPATGLTGAGPTPARPSTGAPVRPLSVTILGGGGTARAALAAAAQLGAREVTVVTRRPEVRAELLPAAAALGLTIVGADWADAPGTFDADAVISTVPKGAADHLASQVTWRRGTVLFDAIYDPWPTPLAAAASANGVPVVSGLDLLLAQALGQFEHFTGVIPAPEEAMRAALTVAASIR